MATRFYDVHIYGRVEVQEKNASKIRRAMKKGDFFDALGDVYIGVEDIDMGNIVLQAIKNSDRD